ncbi:30S ribosomal protein S6 [bioreactor metagenome]|uniref:30S ribosomal protein S6 n=1 Tax=bioreactor metagenome TaxID=1076179 RepID=A0A645AVX0_9ZZZZ|nr:30S ribosomal protein S6 [Oscillospiraceae bacterium]
MEKLQSKYETVFIVNPELGDEAVTTICDKFKALIAANGTIDDVADWGKRRLAYPINDVLDGYYMVIKFTCGHDFPAELDRIFKITDGMLRSVIVKEEE